MDILLFIINIIVLVIAAGCIGAAVFYFVNKNDRSAILYFIMGVLLIWIVNDRGIGIGLLVVSLIVLFIVWFIRRS